MLSEHPLYLTIWLEVTLPTTVQSKLPAQKHLLWVWKYTGNLLFPVKKQKDIIENSDDALSSPKEWEKKAHAK